MIFISKLVRYGSIAAAIVGFYAIFMISRTQAERQLPTSSDPPIIPPQKPYVEAVAATGILEALSENVAIGMPSPGLVSSILVKVNDLVKKDQPLLTLDNRDLLAEQLSTQAQHEIARAHIAVSEAQLATLPDLLAHLRASSGNPKVRVVLGGPIFLVHDVSPISLGADAIFTDAREAVGAVKQLMRAV